ncbi:hypothetical protein [Phormidesmis priestleyi]|uniref:hypothetical protein n=1 Tax=Phormidesmis priestleyi TaxID=268141 RepID=UPI00083A66BF|nr:hypothetical protein [Phormidesmis priestleyi]
MDTRKRGSTSEMQVTSIRLEPELKERLRELSGEQGYQTLIREVLWQFVGQQPAPDGEQSRVARHERSPSHPPRLSMSDIRATFKAIAQQEEQCAITGQIIRPRQVMLLGLTISGKLAPISAIGCHF